MNYVVVNTDTLQIVRFDVRIDFDLLKFLGLDINEHAFFEIPTDLDPEVVMAVRNSEGQVTLTEDPQKVAAKTAQAWSDLRAERNRRLAASDWTQLGDAHMSQERKDAWAQYRQALRDLPDEVTDPTNVTFPNDPSVPVPVQSTGSRLGNLLGQV